MTMTTPEGIGGEEPTPEQGRVMSFADALDEILEEDADIIEALRGR